MYGNKTRLPTIADYETICAIAAASKSHVTQWKFFERPCIQLYAYKSGLGEVTVKLAILHNNKAINRNLVTKENFQSVLAELVRFYNGARISDLDRLAEQALVRTSTRKKPADDKKNGGTGKDGKAVEPEYWYAVIENPMNKGETRSGFIDINTVSLLQSLPVIENDWNDYPLRMPSIQGDYFVKYFLNGKDRKGIFNVDKNGKFVMDHGKGYALPDSASNIRFKLLEEDAE